jgi:hypothetical protein
MARDDEREAIRRAEAPGRPGGARSAGQRGEPAVRDDLAPLHRARRPEELPLELRQPVLVHRYVVVRDGRAREVRCKPPAQIRHEAVTLP